MSRQSILECRKVKNLARPDLTSPYISCVGLQLAGRGEVRVDHQSVGWPEGTKVWCWHCAHSFDTPPIPRPIAYDARMRTWRVQGVFCSWGCAAAACQTPVQSKCLHELHTALHSPGMLIHPAPPKCLLRAFGGVMSIEEFRSNQQTFSVVPPRLITVDPVIIQSEPKFKARVPALVDFSNVTSSNEVFKLKREKPLAAGRGLLPSHAKLVR